MGSAYHRKLDWMNKAADIYLSENNKMAGFVVKFADESGISLLYGYKLNGDRKKNLTRGSKKFSRHASEELSSAPEELREDIVSSDKLIRKTCVACNLQNFSDVYV